MEIAFDEWVGGDVHNGGRIRPTPVPPGGRDRRRGERPVLSKSLKKIAIPRKWRPRSSPPPSFSSIAFLSLSSSTTLRWLKFSPPPLPRTVESSERDCKIACLTLQRRPTNTVIPFSDTRFHPPSFFQSCPPLIMIFWENKDDVCLLLD